MTVAFNFSLCLTMAVFLVLLLVHFAYSNKTVEYLQRFGYLNEESHVDGLVGGVKLFQETFNLTIDGTLNNETVALLESDRCGNKDDLLPFMATPKKKWSKNEVTWYMYSGHPSSDLIERAFGLWSRHANITFRKQYTSPMIYMSLSDTQHICYSKRNTCSYDFDGPHGVLAHAFVPDIYTNHTDVHFDFAENWDYSMNLPAFGKVSFFLTALHEIGHAIGLEHSYVTTSIMYPINTTPVGVTDLHVYDLDPDSINAVQFLYGRPTSKTIPTTTPTTTIPTTIPTTTPTTTLMTTSQPTTTSEQSVDVCKFRNEFNHFLVLKDKLYIVHNKLVWILSLDRAHRTLSEYTSPKLITEWLPFLPQDLTNISAMYQRPNDEVVLIIDQWAYYILTPYLTLKEKRSIKTLAGKPVRKVNAAVSTNQGKTFLFVDDGYVMEINECYRVGTLLGAVSQTFPGIPGTLVGASRYINGRLYFQTGKTVLEFDEFTGTVTRSIDDLHDFLGINCVRESLLTKLYQLIKDLR